jgi:hypothetical protein
MTEDSSACKSKRSLIHIYIVNTKRFPKKPLHRRSQSRSRFRRSQSPAKHALIKLSSFGMFVTADPLNGAWSRVFNPDRPDRAGGVRYRFTGPVRLETGGNWTNSNFKPNSLVQAVGTGIPTGLTGIPDRFDRFPVV